MMRAPSRYRRLPRFNRHLHSVLLVAVIFLIAICASAFSIQYRFRDELQVWFFDIGQGDATFIQTADGAQILIDGGPDDRILQKLASVMLPWDRTIDAIVVTHPDADHITGLVSVLRWYDVGQIIETGARGPTPQSQALSEVIEQKKTVHRLVKAGDRLVFDRLVFDVLWPRETYEGTQPDDRNNTSIVLMAGYDNTSLLFTGDMEEEVETQRSWPDVDVLKAGHHGSVTSTGVSFLHQILPEVTTISAGENNRYGHPHPVVLERLRAVDSVIFRTDQDGDLLLTSDGGEPWVRPYPLPF